MVESTRSAASISAKRAARARSVDVEPLAAIASRIASTRAPLFGLEVAAPSQNVSVK